MGRQAAGRQPTGRQPTGRQPEQSVAVPSAALSGTAVSGLNETDVVAGGETIILTLTNDTWVAAGATFDAVRQAIIDGITAAQGFITGWNNEVRDNEVVGAVIRTSDTVVTITLSPSAGYDIVSNETITVTAPAAALVTSAIDVVAIPGFTSQADVLPNPGLTIVDARYDALVAQFPAGPPTITDLIPLWLVAEGGTGLATTDLWRSMLLGKGATPGTVNDMWKEILAVNGFTQDSLNDAEIAFWAAGGNLA